MTMADDRTVAAGVGARLPVVSMDSHVSPVVSEYRPFCDPEYRDVLDDVIEHIDEHMLAPRGGDQESSPRRERWLAKMQEYATDELNSDVHVRLRFMDEDGIAVETLFHGGFNLQPIPFFTRNLNDSLGQDVPETAETRELRLVGIRMYNRWLADWISAAPERFIGLAQIPLWDVDLCVAEVRAASAAGLRGINFPAPRREMPQYNEEEWYPLWEVCSELGIRLHTHGGGGYIYPTPGPSGYSIRRMEMPFSGRRAIWQMILGGVFEKFPQIKIILTEQLGNWITDLRETLDSAYHSELAQREVPYIQDVLPRMPSEYFRDNVFVGASFMSRMEAERAISEDYWQNYLWGRDFPHPEGTWPFTQASWRKTFAGLPKEKVRAMLAGNAIRAMGLDSQQVQAIADRIGPTLADIDQPLDRRPTDSYTSMGFREWGMWG